MERKRMGDSSSLSACAMSAKKDTAYNRTPSVSSGPSFLLSEQDTQDIKS